MPLHTTTDPAALASFQESQDGYVIFYSSRDAHGKMWCPDCRDVEALVERTFSPSEGPTGMIAYVGQRAEWRIASNPFRKAPWNVQSIPTIIRVRSSKETGRLVESEITEATLADLL
ncbi:uncharacterized protein STEHIDRAFT_127155 [Stereum hirsutum FP-91666 SS1]|uniref:uncharacterized protein n=1 Tax=Stereum hirsutum (strain FP-91666) TaxID=721885 RepID=UPI000440FA17|nr:uncharacterized protein STEHIDRAFT_127155 [Stereum hirsutum FP-91666 SS1]EIM92322.1 hypothetical protein STEHIDRAFT_127155 [Stereum hirsutum FP-91666 SS1]